MQFIMLCAYLSCPDGWTKIFCQYQEKPKNISLSK